MLAPRTFFASFVVMIAGLTAIGCGAGSSATGGIVPRQAALVVVADIRRGSEGQWSRTREVLRRVPAWQLANARIPEPQRVLDQLLVAAGAKPSLDWDEEVEPWLGDHAGLAGWVRSAGDDEFRVMVWIDSSDDDAAAEAMGQAVGTEQDGSFEGTNLYRGTGKRADVYWAVEDGRVLVGNGKGSVTAGLRAARGDAVDEEDGWQRLKGERGGDALMSFYGTPRLGEQMQDLAEESADDEAAGQLRAAAEQLRGEAREFALHVGSRDEGLWMEAVAVGETPATKASESVPAARELLERLPAASVVATASRTAAAMDDEAIDAVRMRIDQYREAFGDDTELPRVVRDVPQLADALLAPELVEQREEAYRGDIAGAITVEDGVVSLVGSYGVQDEDAALAVESEHAAAIGTYLQERTGVRLRRDPMKEGSRLVMAGIPARQAVQRLAAATGTTAKEVRENPLVRRFVRPQLELEQRVIGDDMVFALPADAIALVEGARAGTGETLADAERYQRDVQTVDVPEDAHAMFWVDLRELLRPFIEPVQGQAWVLVSNQIDHVGGPIGWSRSEEDGTDTVRTSAVEIPLYD